MQPEMVFFGRGGGVGDPGGVGAPILDLTGMIVVTFRG